MTIQTEEYTLPTYWAPALINDDYSGMSDEDELEISEFIAEEREGHKMFSCVAIADDAHFSMSVGGDVSTYTFQVA